jgi:hypothetical protein
VTKTCPGPAAKTHGKVRRGAGAARPSRASPGKKSTPSQGVALGRPTSSLRPVARSPVNTWALGRRVLADHTLVALILCAACASGPQPGPRPAFRVFELSGGCSPDRNPNGVWQYGYTAGAVLSPSAFRRAGFHDRQSTIGFWQPSDTAGSGHYPYVACNASAKTVLVGEHGTRYGLAARAGQVAMEASNIGQYSVVRFTAPLAGKYRVIARFEGIHFGLSTTDVHVMHGEDSLFAADIEGYGGDPGLHAITGAKPVAVYTGIVKLRAGDTVDFAVGYGKNRTHYFDTTGLSATLELIATD